MRYVLLLVFAFAFTGCSFFKSSGCEVGKAATNLISAQISTSLACKNGDAIKADIEKKLTDLKICEAAKPAAMNAMSAIGTTICGPIVSTLAAGLVGQIPPAWECTGGQLTDDIKLKLLEACQKAL